MDKFVKLTGVAAPLPVVNIDTDMIIPKDYLKTIKRTGLGTGLFAEARYNEDGSENPDFVLNKPAYRDAKILVAGDNFGCGFLARTRFPGRCSISSIPLRDLHQLSPTFSTITASRTASCRSRSARKNLDKLMDDASRGSNAILTVDLENLEITGPDGGSIKFDLDEFKRHCLLNGLDDIGLTLEKGKAIDEFEKKNASAHPWAA